MLFVERQGLVIIGIVLVCGGVAVGLQVQSRTDDEAHADRGEQERVRQNCRRRRSFHSDLDLFVSVVMPRLPQNIWVAAADGDLPRVQLLVEANAINPNQPDDNSYTPMSVPVFLPPSR